MFFLKKEEMVTLSAAVIKFQHKICSSSSNPRQPCVSNVHPKPLGTRSSADPDSIGLGVGW